MTPWSYQAAMVFAALVLLHGCGGGSSTAPPVAPADTLAPVIVVDTPPDGSLTNQPLYPPAVQGGRINLLVRDVRPDRGYLNNTVYTLGNRSYGPFNDHFRRCQVTALVEVKNHALQ